MQLDTRLARLLHVLVHMHLRGGSTTSANIALMLHTNPVVVRRTMAALRDAGYVRSAGGRGGGWELARDLRQITVKDVYDAIAHNALFAIGAAADNPACPVEAAVNRHLESSLNAAQALALQLFGAKSLADIADEVLASSAPRDQ